MNDVYYVLISRTPCYDCLGKRLVGDDELDVRLFTTLENAQEAMVWFADTLADEWGEPTMCEKDAFFDAGCDGPQLRIIETMFDK